LSFTWRSTLNFLYQVARFSTKYYGWKYDLIKTRLYGSSMCYCTEDLFKEAQAPLGLYTNLLLSGKEPQALFLTKESKVFLSQVVKQQVLAAEAGKNLKSQFRIRR
jgi:succinate-semialdehyde dehydrogenase/glutarate-semialdehyde dehydrogenase